MAATGATLQPPTTRVQTKKMLPYGWPLFAAFGLFPLWYVLGMGALIWFFLAIPMTFSLVARSKVRIPRGFGLFMLFFIWMLATVVQLQGSGTDRLFGFAYRAGLYYSAGVWCLYLFNAPKKLLPTRTVLKAMTFMWIVVVAGGWLGILSPSMEFTTLTEKLMPQGLQNNDLVYTLIHPKVAEVQTFLGYDVARPQAPFDFSNNWGGNFALLLPFVCAFWGQLRTLTRRNLLRLVAVGSMIPVVFSLNRTLWLCLVVTLVYGGARFAIRGKGKGGFQAICGVAIVAYLMFNFGPVGQLISDRAATNHSGSGRALLYNEAADSVKKSPLLGYGAPRASQRNPNLPPVGTQGHFWLVFFSHGFPGAIFFVGFVGSAMWRTRRAKTAAALWCHISLLLAMIMMPFYGLFHMQIHVVAIAFALAAREMVDPDEPAEPAAAPKARAYVVSTVRTDRAPALSGASNGNGNGNGHGHSNGKGHAPSNDNGTGMTTWGRAGDAPEGWS